MGSRPDLSYKKSEEKVPYIMTGARDIDDALDKAFWAISDAQDFRSYAKATGTDVVRTDISVGMAFGCFAAGAIACAFVFWCCGVI